MPVLRRINREALYFVLLVWIFGYVLVSFKPVNERPWDGLNILEAKKFDTYSSHLLLDI